MATQCNIQDIANVIANSYVPWEKLPASLHDAARAAQATHMLKQDEKARKAAEKARDAGDSGD